MLPVPSHLGVQLPATPAPLAHDDTVKTVSDQKNQKKTHVRHFFTPADNRLLQVTSFSSMTLP